VLLPLLLLTSLAFSDPTPGYAGDSAVTPTRQEPSKPKAAPKQSPKPAPPKPSAAPRTKPPAGGSGSARPQAPRGKPGGIPRATGEPRLKRRGT
jgi:hypothetical protein